MAIGKYSLMFVLMILIGIVYKTTGLHCPAYQKQDALIDGLLSDRAICRAKYISFNEVICLNGELPVIRNDSPMFQYCATGACNVFGFNCDGHCLSGDDFIYGEIDFALNCDVSMEIEKLCIYFKKYEPIAVFYTPKLEKLCPSLKSDFKKSIENKLNFE